MDLITIFIFIGVAHWAAHITNCIGCKSFVWGGFHFLLEAAIQILGWPLQAIEHIIGLIARYRPNRARVAAMVAEETDKLFALRGIPQGLTFGDLNKPLTIEQGDNEPDEVFQARIFETIREQTKEVQDRRGVK